MADNFNAERQNKNKKGNERNMETMTINGEEWVKKSSIPANEGAMAAKVDGLPYKMVRTYSAGVFAGYVESLDGQHAVLRNARRIWYWDGAASLSELATRGTSKPDNCKFPCAVNRVELTNVIELIDITDEAAKSIAEVAEWTQH